MAARKAKGRTIHYPGKPDPDNYGKPAARWRHLKGETGGLVIFGYEGIRDYIGIPPQDMKSAPCSHCGQLAFARYAEVAHPAKFLLSSHPIIHTCPGFLGRDSAGREVPCPEGKEHVCTGQPSMSWHGVSRFSRQDWKEVT